MTTRELIAALREGPLVTSNEITAANRLAAILAAWDAWVADHSADQGVTLTVLKRTILGEPS